MIIKYNIIFGWPCTMTKIVQPEFSLNCCNYRTKSIKTVQVCARVFVAFTKYVTREIKGWALDHRLSISTQMPKRRLHGADNLVGMHFGYISQLQWVTFVINQQTIKTIPWTFKNLLISAVPKLFIHLWGAGITYKWRVSWLLCLSQECCSTCLIRFAWAGLLSTVACWMFEFLKVA